MASNMYMEVIADNAKAICKELEESIKKALIKCGQEAQGLATERCPVDTGYLRNSITYCLDGEAPDSPSFTDDAGKQMGFYEGSAPSEGENTRSVYVGTNVEYAIPVELGTSKQAARHYLGRCANDAGRFQSIFSSELASG